MTKDPSKTFAEINLSFSELLLTVIFANGADDAAVE